MVGVTMTKSEIRVQPMDPEDLAGVAAVIAESFRHEGFTRTLKNLSTPQQRQRYVDAGTVRLLLAHYTGRQVLTAIQDGAIVGVSIVKTPGAKLAVPWYRLAGMVIRHAPLWLSALPDLRWRRVVQIIPAMNTAAEPPKPYYTLDILAVSPKSQGQGVGRQLLDHIHAQCDRDAQASGIYLFTGDEKNTHIYRRFGYEVLEVKQAGPLTVWHMFRPYPANDAGQFFASLRETAKLRAPSRRLKAALPALAVVGLVVGIVALWRLLHPSDAAHRLDTKEIH